jgi:hypothetical protein
MYYLNYLIIHISFLLPGGIKLKEFLDSDPNMTNQANFITGEMLENITKNESISLKHDVYFAESLIIINNIGDTPLILHSDYITDNKDKPATLISGKDCYQRIKFLKNFESVSVTYHVYGDFLRSLDINTILENIEYVKGHIDSPLDDSVTDDMIGSRTLQDQDADHTLLSVLSPKKITCWLQSIFNNVKALFLKITEIITKIQALKGYGGFLEPHDFGSASPSQQQLTGYALSEINKTDQLDIFNGTHVKNIWINPNLEINPNQVPDNNVWVLTNTPDTNPPVYEWINDGPSGISNSSNVRYGVIKGVADLGDGTNNGYLTIDEAGNPKVIGFGLIHTKQDKIPSGSDKVLLGPATEGAHPGTMLLSDFLQANVENNNKPEKSALVITPTNDNFYNEGMRLNFAPNLWSGIVLGGKPGTLSGMEALGYNANQSDKALRQATWWIASNTSGDFLIAQSSAGAPKNPYGIYLKRDGTGFIGQTGTTNEENQILTEKVLDYANIRLYAADLGLPTANQSTATTNPFFQTGKSLTLTINQRLKLAILNGWVQVGNNFTGGYDISQIAIPCKYLPKSDKQGYVMFNINLDTPATGKQTAPKAIAGYLTCPADDSGSKSILLRFGPAGSIGAGEYTEAFFDTTWFY